MLTAYLKSIEDDRMPPIKGKVRATTHLMAMVIKSDTDPSSGKDISHCMFLANIDINGLVPKWAVNLGARSAPTLWFADVQRACNLFS
jgi:hypothetical protein